MAYSPSPRNRNTAGQHMATSGNILSGIVQAARDLISDATKALELAEASEALKAGIFFTYTATENQTVFSGPDDAGAVLQLPGTTPRVFVDGTEMAGIGFTVEDNGATVRLNVGLAQGRQLMISRFTVDGGEVLFNSELAASKISTILAQLDSASTDSALALTTAESAATDAAAAVSAANTAIATRTIENGGTGATSVNGAVYNLGLGRLPALADRTKPSVPPAVPKISDIATSTIFPLDSFETRGFAAEGDGGGCRWRSISGELNAAWDCKQDSAGAWFVRETPIFLDARAFGVVTDGEYSPELRTDNTEKLNAAANFARISGCILALPPGVVYCAGTLYLGGVSVMGAGAPTNSEHSFISRSVIVSKGNPMVSMAPSAETPVTTAITQWENFSLLSDRAGLEFLPDHHDTVELWSRAEYPYQIGLWLGRSHHSMMRTDYENPLDPNMDGPTRGGSGGLRLRNVNVHGASGLGVYGYKLWGMSILDGVFCRGCGGAGAYHTSETASYAVDRDFGGLLFEATTVDVIIRNFDVYPYNYQFTGGDTRGMGARLGGIRADAEDPGLARYWEAGGNIVFDWVFLENCRFPLLVEAAKTVEFRSVTIGGANGLAEIHLGHPDNPAADCRIRFDYWRLFRVGKIHIAGSDMIDLGQLEIQAGETEIHYENGFAVSVPGSQDLGNIYAGISPETRLPKLMPRMPTSTRRGHYGFRPLARADFDQGRLDENLLPPFTYNNEFIWERNGTGTTNGRALGYTHDMPMHSGAAVTAEVLNLAPDRLCTFIVWVSIRFNTNFSDCKIDILNGADEVIYSNVLRSGSHSAANLPVMEAYAVNFRTPGISGDPWTETVKIRLTKVGGSTVVWINPTLVYGAMDRIPRRPARLWHNAWNTIHTYGGKIFGIGEQDPE